MAFQATAPTATVRETAKTKTPAKPPLLVIALLELDTKALEDAFKAVADAPMTEERVTVVPEAAANCIELEELFEGNMTLATSVSLTKGKYETGIGVIQQ
jgi:hypothetical protein